MQLRYLQTLTQVAGDKSSTLVFPVPVDLLGKLMRQDGGTRASEAARPQSSTSASAIGRNTSAAMLPISTIDATLSGSWL